jgi:hypothetical protein
MWLESYIIFSTDDSNMFTMAPVRVLMFHFVCINRDDKHFICNTLVKFLLSNSILS